MSKFSVVLFLVIFHLVVCEKNNVCQNMEDYVNIDNNKNCWYNPDVGSSSQEIITRHGYPFESYNITTEDGYFNILYRIPYNNTDKKTVRQPVLLHAGLSGGPSTFLYLGNRSLAFFLVNNGFDVWLSNRRGSTNGTVHRNFTNQDAEFWNFSFHECGYYDIKSEINFISKTTKKRHKIILLGYSLGTTESYVYAILRKKHAKQHVAGIISLTPIAFMKDSGGSVAQLAPYADMIESFLENMNIHALLLQEKFAESEENVGFGLEDLITTRTVLNYILGNESSQIDAADLPVYLESKPSPTSVKTLKHFAQEIISGGNFQHYDYGPKKNLELYNSTEPRLYDVSKIRVPVHLFYGEGDLIANKEDVVKLYNKLRVKNKSLIGIPQDKKIKFNHIDFVLAKDSEKLLYKVLLKTIKENLTG